MARHQPAAMPRRVSAGSSSSRSSAPTNIVGLPLYETATLLSGEGFPIHFGWLNAV
jgi:hypothetical protein